jgi:hypothetical protein
MGVFWCAGMYASGSTWAYNVMRAIAAGGGGQVKARFANTPADLAGIGDAAADHVIKTHDLPEEAAALLFAQSPRIVVTIRDPRDAVASLMTYQHYPFELALATVARSARFVTSVAERGQALLLRYEAGFPDDPATVAHIADAMGLVRDAVACDAIFRSFRRDAVERFIGGLESLPQAHHDARSGDVFDPETQWHKHHAGRTGEVGRWRGTLVFGQPAAVETALADWMERYGYEKAPAFGATFGTGYSVSLGSVTFGKR